MERGERERMMSNASWHFLPSASRSGARSTPPPCPPGNKAATRRLPWQSTARQSRPPAKHSPRTPPPSSPSAQGGRVATHPPWGDQTAIHLRTRWGGVDRVEHLHGKAHQPGQWVVVILAMPPSPALAGAPLPLSPTQSALPRRHHTDGLSPHRHDDSDTDITTYPHLTAPPACRPLLPPPPVVIVVTPQVAARSYSRISDQRGGLFSPPSLSPRHSPPSSSPFSLSADF